MAGVSNHYDAMTALKTLIEGASLSGLSSTGVLIQEVAEHDEKRLGTILPFISISPYGQETTEDANINEDGVGYPILIGIVAAPDATALETRLGWRQKIRRRLWNRSLSGLTMNYNIKPEPLPIVDPAAWRIKMFCSGIVARVFFEEPRT